jgi:hypothetical protein
MRIGYAMKLALLIFFEKLPADCVGRPRTKKPRALFQDPNIQVPRALELPQKPNADVLIVKVEVAVDIEAGGIETTDNDMIM